MLFKHFLLRFIKWYLLLRFIKRTIKRKKNLDIYDDIIFLNTETNQFNIISNTQSDIRRRSLTKGIDNST